MKAVFNVLLAASVLASPVLSQEPKQAEAKKTSVAPDRQLPKLTISGADKPIQIGELVVLDATLDTLPKDLSAVSYAWTVLPQNKNIVTWPDGTKIIFGTGIKPQNVTVILTASFVYTIKDGDKITDVALKTTTTIATLKIIDEGGVEPTPGPVDPIAPESALTQNAKNWVKLVKTTNKYSASDVKSDAIKLANNFERIAASIAAGTLKTSTAILKTTKESNDASINNRDEWLPFFNALSEHLQSANKSGTLRTDDQYAAAWREISKGLKASTK